MSRIPKTAKVIRWASCPMPSGHEYSGTMHLRIWEGYASQGYKSGYERIPHRWMEISVEDGETIHLHKVWAYSRGRWDTALQHWEDNLEGMREEAPTTVHLS